MDCIGTSNAVDYRNRKRDAWPVGVWADVFTGGLGRIYRRRTGDDSPAVAQTVSEAADLVGAPGYY